LLTDRSGTLKKLGMVVVAMSLAACSSGKPGSGSGGGIASTGGSAGGITSGGSIGTATGGSSGGSVGSGSGSSTGAVDGGCGIGAQGGLALGSVCLFPFDCDCGLQCAPDVSGGSANLICQDPCRVDSDCPLFGEKCQTDAGVCLGGLYGSCSGMANLEFAACTSNTDCPCPLECYPDPVLGPACEHSCDSNAWDNAYCHVYTFCDLQVGSCQLGCTTSLMASTEFGPCAKPTDCQCPNSCFGDARRGGLVCEAPCGSDLDCADAGEYCETDAGACQRGYDCYGGDAGLAPFANCVNAADCACPDNCVADPSLQPKNASAPPKLCEQCNASGCQSISGTCQTPSPPGAFQSSDITPCTSNDQCTCPNSCTISAASSVLLCEQACTDSSGCTDPGQFCVNGQCVENTCPTLLACNVDDGQAALSDDAGIGTCFPSPLGTMVCHVGGTADAGCDPMATRSDTADLCQTGLACAADSDGGFHCVASCAQNSDCLDGDQCIGSLGICLPLNDAGSCFIGGTPVEFQACYPGYDILCGCAYDCVSNVCMQPCQKDSDCIDPTLICYGTIAHSYCVKPPG
jgi:hypothetical protein